LNFKELSHLNCSSKYPLFLQVGIQHKPDDLNARTTNRVLVDLQKDKVCNDILRILTRYSTRNVGVCWKLVTLNLRCLVSWLFPDFGLVYMCVRDRHLVIYAVPCRIFLMFLFHLIFLL